jgi:hypothetical protein
MLLLTLLLLFLRQNLINVAQGDLKLAILLPLPPEYWYYKSVLPCTTISNVTIDEVTRI